MKKGKENGLTQRSIMYWVKETNPPEYEKIKKKTVEFYMEKVLTDMLAFLLKKDVGMNFRKIVGNAKILEIL